MAHSFKESLKKSIRERDAGQWDTIYKSFFPTLRHTVYKPQNGRPQQLGVDTVIYMKDTDREIYIDEKERDKDYGDILLEYWSAYEYRRKGWVASDLACDYIAYLVKPTGQCFMLPFQLLRHAWRIYHKTWVATYKPREAANDGYTTISVAVPVNILLDAIAESLIVK